MPIFPSCVVLAALLSRVSVACGCPVHCGSGAMVVSCVALSCGQSVRHHTNEWGTDAAAQQLTMRRQQLNDATSHTGFPVIDKEKDMASRCGITAEGRYMW